MLSINSVIWNASTIHVFSSHLTISFAPFQLSHKLDSSGWTRHSHGMVRGPGCNAHLTLESRFLPGENGRLLEFFSQWGGKKQNRQAKNTRKGDSKQIVTQITGQRHTEVRVEMGGLRGKMVAGFFRFISALIFLKRSFDPSGWNPGWNRNFWWILYDFLVSASCGLYIP